MEFRRVLFRSGVREAPVVATAGRPHDCLAGDTSGDRCGTAGWVMDLRSLWDMHRAAGWPKFSHPSEGELMTLDTVISGCATYYFDEQGLDAQRVAMLGHCLDDLDT